MRSANISEIFKVGASLIRNLLPLALCPTFRQRALNPSGTRIKPYLDFFCNTDDNDCHNFTQPVLKIVIRAYIRPEPNFPESRQRPSIEAPKPGIIYVEGPRQPGKDPWPVRTAWLKSLRKKDRDVVGLSHLHRLAPDSADLRAALRAIEEQGVPILETSTGRVSTKVSDMAAMIFDAQDFYAQRGLTTERARELAKQGADASPVTKPKKGRMPHAQAIVFLNDITMSIKDAIRQINKDKRYKVKWTFVYAYREKKAGRLPFADRKAGPKPKS